MYEKELIDLYLNGGFDADTAKSEIAFVCDILFNLTSKDFALGAELNDDLRLKLRKIITERTRTKRPIQQLAGFAFFMSEKFIVNENVLIPRPETEILVSETLKEIEKRNAITVCDIGTGSGCIAVSVAENTENVKIIAVDISEKALETAKENAKLHGVEEKIIFKKSDLLENAGENFDIIVSNPPYIPQKDKDNLQEEVRDFDPEIALFAPDENGVMFYEKIVKQAQSGLNRGGALLFELGINQSGFVKEILTKQGFQNISIIKDLDNIDRVIKAEKV